MLHQFGGGRPFIRILDNETNQGFVKTANRGLALARNEKRDVILVNADTQTFPGTLKALVEVAYSDDQIGFVSPRSNNAAFCSLPHSNRDLRPDPAAAYQRWKTLSRTMPLYHFTPTAVGFYLFIKHLVIANFGLLNEDFGTGYEEENDLIMRANKGGYRAAVANHSFAYHIGSASFEALGLNVEAQRSNNAKRIAKVYPEFLPLMRRYQSSAHFKAEELLGELLESTDGRIKIVFQLPKPLPRIEGAMHVSVSIARALCERFRPMFDVNVLSAKRCEDIAEFSGTEGLRWHSEGTPERFAIAVHFGLPFSVDELSAMERLAPINVFTIFDTMVEDRGDLSLLYRADVWWHQIARHADGLIFVSKSSEGAFLARHREAETVKRYARLLPTRLGSDGAGAKGGLGKHILIMGDDLSSEAVDAAACLLREGYPSARLIVCGAGEGSPCDVEKCDFEVESAAEDVILSEARVVVLPAYVEGFGFKLIRALSSGRVVVARDGPAIREILATYKSTEGCFRYSDDSELVATVRMALGTFRSRVNETSAQTWSEWVDGFAGFCRELLAADRIFERVVERIRSGDMMREPAERRGVQWGAAADQHRQGVPWSLGRLRKSGEDLSVGDLLELDGERFLESVYNAILDRAPDPAGRRHYLDRLKDGARKEQIIWWIRKSEEGRALDRPLKGSRWISVREGVLWLIGR
jgi:GT2 family glycosyltransferase